MSLFNFFRKKKVDLTEDQRKWNKMWELWGDGNVESPYGEIMTYQSEINNGGHSQYFFNTDNCVEFNALIRSISSSETTYTPLCWTVVSNI